MNIGYVEASKIDNYNCFIFHDIDLLPLSGGNEYSCPTSPRHMSVAVNTMDFGYVVLRLPIHLISLFLQNFNLLNAWYCRYILNFFLHFCSVPYEGIFGGVSAILSHHFKEVNGYPNRYWGWGGEDDDLSER